MEHRLLGRSGFKVPVLSLGTATFAGKGMFETWGSTDVKQASRMIDICLEAGMNFFDTADIYSAGAAEEILGQALKKRRDQVLLSTKGTFTMGDGPNDKGSSRFHIVKAVDASLKRLQTDHIDLYFLHAYDGLTPMEEIMGTLNDLVQAGKLRYTGCSNFSGWQVMKSIAVSEKYGWNRHVAYQGYYSLIGREYEWELMPMAMEQGLGTMVWSPLGWGRLTGKIRRGQAPQEGRIANGGADGGPEVSDERLFKVTDALEAVAEQTGKTMAQVALNWLLSRPTIANIVVGARNEEQLRQNIGACEFKLSGEQIKILDDASRVTPTYPYWHQRYFTDRIPMPTEW